MVLPICRTGRAAAPCALLKKGHLHSGDFLHDPQANEIGYQKFRIIFIREALLILVSGLPECK
jgi:hypothetical protein